MSQPARRPTNTPEAQRRWRLRSGRTRTVAVPLAELGEQLVTADDEATVAALEALVGREIAGLAREAYRRRHLSPEVAEPVA